MKKNKNNPSTSLAGLKIPNHVGIIMDGNGRWAKMRGLPRKMGHIEGVEAIKRVLIRCKEVGIKVLSVFAFSTENWNRPKEEVAGLMKLIKKMFTKEIKQFLKENVQVRCSGDLEHTVPEDVKQAILSGTEKTKDCDSMIFNVCFNYGGRLDIIQAVNKALRLGKKEITEAEFNNLLYTVGLPDPDVIVRTSGEQRVSNFLMWQMAYSEFIFVKDKHWPEFTAEDVDNMVLEFNKRERRFGAIKE